MRCKAAAVCRVHARAVIPDLMADFMWPCSTPEFLSSYLSCTLPAEHNVRYFANAAAAADAGYRPCQRYHPGMRYYA